MASFGTYSVSAPLLFAVATLPLSYTLTMGMLPAVAVALTFFVFGKHLLTRREIFVPGSLLALSGIPLVLIAVASLPGTTLRTAIWGNSFEIGTVGFLVCFAFCTVAASLVDHHTIRRLLAVFVVSVILSAIVSILELRSSFDLLGNDTLSGSWVELSFLLVAATFITAQFAATSAGRTRYMWIAALVALIGATLCFYARNASILLAVASFALVILYICSRVRVDRSGVALLAAVGIASSLLAVVSPRPPVQLPGDLHPSLRATVVMIGTTYAASTKNEFLGSGPHTFAKSWERFRPQAMHMPQQPGTRVEVVHDRFSSFALMFGAIGTIAFLAFLASPLALMWNRRSEIGGAMQGDRELTGTLVSSSLFMAAALFLYPAGLPFMYMLAVIIGLTFASALQKIVIHVSNVRAIMTGLAFFAVAGCFAYVTVRQAVAAIYHAKAVATDEIDVSERLFEKAVNIWPSPLYAQKVARANLAIALTLAPNAETTEQSVNTFRGVINKASLFADASFRLDPKDPEQAIFRASLLLYLTSEGAGISLSDLEEALDQAAMLAPSEPQVPYMRAVLATLRKDGQTARIELKKALFLDPNHEESLRLREQIGVAL